MYFFNKKYTFYAFVKMGILHSISECYNIYTTETIQ